MYVKYNSTLHGPLAPGGKPPLSVSFLRKFLTIVKRRSRQATSHIICNLVHHLLILLQKHAGAAAPAFHLASCNAWALNYSVTEIGPVKSGKGLYADPTNLSRWDGCHPGHLRRTTQCQQSGVLLVSQTPLAVAVI